MTVEIEFYTQSYIRRGSGVPPVERSYDFYDRVLTAHYGGQGRNTVEAGPLAVRYDVGSASIGLGVLQKIRVNINGRSLIDPISGSEWFQVKLDNRIGC